MKLRQEAGALGRQKVLADVPHPLVVPEQPLVAGLGRVLVEAHHAPTRVHGLVEAALEQ